MNFIIEDDIDFYDELNNLNSDNECDTQVCLLSKVPLDKNNIKLFCGHSFNFEPLFKEVCNQKKNSHTSFLEVNKLAYNEIKCPYCRQTQNKLLPHVKINNSMEYIGGVNSPEQICMTFHKCNYIFNIGKNKGKYCNKVAYHDVIGCYCYSHNIRMNNKQYTPLKVEFKKCISVLKSGKRKGEFCCGKVGNETSEYCKRHLSK